MPATYGKDLHALINAIDVVREDADLMPVQQLQVFLTVAAFPGINTRDLMKRTGLSQSSCSRNVAALGEWHRLGKPGLGLVEAVDDPRETRRKLMFLSPKGQRRIERMLSAISGQPVTYEARRAKEFVREAHAEALKER